MMSAPDKPGNQRRSEEHKREASPFPPSLAIMVIVMLLSLSVLNACGRDNLEINDMPSGVVKVQIGEIKLDIPMEYFYWEKVKRKHWPIAKKDRIKTKAILLDFVLPGFDGYSEKTRPIFESLGATDKSTAIVQEWDSHRIKTEEIVRGLKRITPNPDLPDLERYAGRSSRSEEYRLISDDYLRIRCVDKQDQPNVIDTCETEFKYLNLSVEYTFEKNYLKQWHDIHQGFVRRLSGWIIKGE